MKPLSFVRYLIIGAVAGGLVCLAVAVFGCATTSKVTGPIVATVKDCANEVTHSVTIGILDDVSAVLICDAGSAANLPACVITQLAAIAKKAGWQAVDCALLEIQQEASSNFAASSDRTENLRMHRAAAAMAWRDGPDGGTGP